MQFLVSGRQLARLVTHHEKVGYRCLLSTHRSIAFVCWSQIPTKRPSHYVR